MTAREPTWTELWVEAKAADMVAVAERLGARLKRVKSDWVGACPLGCAQHDGLIVTPSKGLFFCRPSGATGDAVDMVVHVQGCDKLDALEFVTGKRPAQSPPDDPPPPKDAAARKKEQSDEEAIDAVLKRAKPIKGTHAEAYLRARGIDPQPKLTKDLLFVPDLAYWNSGPQPLAVLPAMVAIIRDAAGDRIGLHQTYLDPKEPRKWMPPGDLPAKKVRGHSKGGLIRLGRVGDKLAIGEGIETTLKWYGRGVGPEDVTIACGVSLDNIAGGCTGTLAHPILRANGKPARIPNGQADPAKPGIILPEDVRELILLGDGDGERLATQAKMAAAVRRHLKDELAVSVHMATEGKEFADEIGDDMPPIEGAEAFLERIAPVFAPSTADASGARVISFAEARKSMSKRIRVIMGSDVKLEAIDWLWPEWLAHGKLHIIAGRPGALKTTTMVGFAAVVSFGGEWPDGSRAARGKVVIWSGEDAINDTLMPRFVAAGGDPAQVAFISGVEEGGRKRNFDPSRDMDDLVAVCAELGGVALIIIDPVVAVAKGDSHKNAEARRDLQPLVDLAERTNAAVVGVHHFTKRSEDADPLDRVSGSLAFGAGPRVVLLSALDRKAAGGERRGVLMRAKNNVGPSHGGIEFTAETWPLADYPGIAA